MYEAMDMGHKEGMREKDVERNALLEQQGTLNKSWMRSHPDFAVFKDLLFPYGNGFL
jgi:hypothetical protein